jgi:hypothetical protein
MGSGDERGTKNEGNRKDRQRKKQDTIRTESQAPEFKDVSIRTLDDKELADLVGREVGWIQSMCG